MYFRTFAGKNLKTRTDMKTRTEIIHLLNLYKPTAQSKYGLTRLGIFGSVARGEQTEDSDVDVCYEGRVPSLLTLDLIQTEEAFEESQKSTPQEQLLF